VQDDLLRPGADDLHAADRDLAREAVLERLFDPRFDESGETGRAEVPPAAADDQQHQHETDAEEPEDPLHAAPHRAAALALARRPPAAPP
jgi:hypothetical protein